MKALHYSGRVLGNQGYTLLEVLIVISLLTLILAALLPGLLLFKNRESLWQKEINLGQEAIRFFTYLQNRNSCLLGWRVQSGVLTVEVCGQHNGRAIERQIYQSGARVVEVDRVNGGFLLLAHMVDDIQFIPQRDLLLIKLTLKKGRQIETFHGVLVRRIET
jgi:prepilin-type N-terminal cleavage/methylation domain-containing protein